MIAQSSPQLQAEGETSSKPTYASFISPQVATQSLTKTQLKSIEFNHGEPIIKFTMEEIAQYTIEEGLHQALVLKFSYGQPEMKEIRKLVPKLLGVKGQCLLGWLARRHILIRFDKYEDYVLAASKVVNYLHCDGEDFLFRMFPWCIGFNPNEESSRAFTWISLPNLPPELFAKRSLLSIASAVGKPIAIDKATQEKSRPSTARVKVELDLLDKHPKHIRVQYIDEKTGKVMEHVQEFVFDNLPLFCSFCKHQGHEENSCRLILDTKRYNIQKSSLAQYQGDAREILNEKRRIVSGDQNEVAVLPDHQVLNLNNEQILTTKMVVDASKDGQQTAAGTSTASASADDTAGELDAQNANIHGRQHNGMKAPGNISASTDGEQNNYAATVTGNQAIVSAGKNANERHAKELKKGTMQQKENPTSHDDGWTVVTKKKSGRIQLVSTINQVVSAAELDDAGDKQTPDKLDKNSAHMTDANMDIDKGKNVMVHAEKGNPSIPPNKPTGIRICEPNNSTSSTLVERLPLRVVDIPATDAEVLVVSSGEHGQFTADICAEQAKPGDANKNSVTCEQFGKQVKPAMVDVTTPSIGQQIDAAASAETQGNKNSVNCEQSGQQVQPAMVDVTTPGIGQPIFAAASAETQGKNAKVEFAMTKDLQQNDMQLYIVEDPKIAQNKTSTSAAAVQPATVIRDLLNKGCGIFNPYHLVTGTVDSTNSFGQIKKNVQIPKETMQFSNLGDNWSGNQKYLVPVEFSQAAGVHDVGIQHIGLITSVKEIHSQLHDNQELRSVQVPLNTSAQEIPSQNQDLCFENNDTQSLVSSATNTKKWADLVEPAEEQEGDNIGDHDIAEILGRKSLSPNAPIFVPANYSLEKHVTGASVSVQSPDAELNAATRRSNAQKNIRTDKDLLDALINSNSLAPINTSKQLHFAGTSKLSPKITQGIDLFEEGEEDEILDSCFKNAAREAGISPRQQRSGRSNNKKKKTHGRNLSWDDKESEDFIPRQLPMRQAKQKVAAPTTSIRSNRSKKT